MEKERVTHAPSVQLPGSAPDALLIETSSFLRVLTLSWPHRHSYRFVSIAPIRVLLRRYPLRACAHRRCNRGNYDLIHLTGHIAQEAEPEHWPSPPAPFYHFKNGRDVLQAFDIIDRSQVLARP
jgi:hypothetical protein